MSNISNSVRPVDSNWRGANMSSRHMPGQELPEKRGRCSKVFDLGRGARQHVLYPEAVHFQDAAGRWNEIDNSLSRGKNSAGESVYRNKSNPILLQVADTPANVALVRLADAEGNSLAWSLDGADTNVKVKVKKSAPRFQDEDDRRSFITALESTAVYEEILPHVDVACHMRGTAFKDDIILKDAQSQHTFKLRMTCSPTLRIVKDGDGTILARPFDPRKQPVFTLPPAFMRDAQGNVGAVDTQLIRSEAGIELVLTCDEGFFAEAVYPVSIDPIVHTVEHSSSMEDNFVTTLSPNTVQNYAQGRLRVCKNASYGECRSFLKFTNLPAIGSADTITKAYLKMSLYTKQSTQAVPVHLKEVTQDWSSQTITWNNQPATAEHDTDYVIVPANAGQGSSFHFDISNLVRKWYDGQNYGVMFERRIATTPNTVEFVSSDSVYNKPVVLINYVSNAGLEDYMTYETYDCGRAGVAHVNLCNGNLVLARPLTTCSGNRMPVPITLYYNNNVSGFSAYMSGGWCLSYDEYVYAANLNGTLYYVYKQGDGTEHYFQQESGVYKDLSGLSMKMTVSDAEMVITSKDGIERHFKRCLDNGDTYGYLLSMNDPCGNTATFSYNSDGNLTEITDGAGRVTTLTYNSSLTLQSILAPGETQPIQFGYYDYDLTTVTDADGEDTRYEYNTFSPKYLLSGMYDLDGRGLFFTYTDTRPYRIADVREMAPNGEDIVYGNHRKYTYGDRMTTVQDMTVENGKRLIYQFNDWGNVVSVRDELGYASYNKFSDALLPGHPEQVSKLQRSVVNLLPNHNFESDGSWSSVAYGGVGTFGYATDQKYLGTRSMKVNKTNSDGNMCVKMDYGNLSIGKTYTLSGYIRSTGNVYTYATASFGNKWYDGEKVTPGGEWTRIFTTFTASAVNATLYFITMGGPGTMWIDCAQLEEGAVPNRYNLLQNCDFSQNNSGMPASWAANGANTPSDGIVTGADALHPAFLTNNRMRLYGDPQINKGFYQDLPLSGSQGDVYVAGGWAKGYSRPIRDESRRFCIRVAFRNGAGAFVDGGFISWNEEWTDWQYINGAVIAPSAYTAVRFNVDYEKNLNYADFDGLTLYKEEFGNTFSYDEDGNVTAVKNLAKLQAHATYDAYDNLTGYVQPGRPDTAKTTMTYGSSDAEKKKRLLRSLESPSHIHHSYQYDSMGNRTETTLIDIMDGTMVIQTATTYTPDGNHKASETDARGKTAIYHTDMAKDTLMSVTDPNGQTVSYSYDARKRITSTSATAGGVLYKATYTYQNDRLKTAAHNTVNDTPDVNYSFEYDKLGNPTTVKVGTQALFTNVYTGTGDKLLLRVDYGNGGKIGYTYDAFKRLKGTTYDSAATPRFTYDYGANGQAAYIRDAVLNRTFWTEYDTAERPIRTHQLENATSSSIGTPRYVATLGYDSFSNLASFKEKVANTANYETTYTYDTENRVTDVRFGADNRRLNIVYDEIGRVSTRTAVGSASYATTYGYYGPDPSDSILTSPFVASITQTGENFSYTYDNAGNITSVTRGSVTTTYGYDTLGQLTRVNDPYLNQTWVYTYDRGGNLVSKQRYAYTTGSLSAVAQTIAYTYADANWKDKLTAYNGKAITHDAIGNPLTYDGWAFVWQAGRQLASMTKTGVSAQFTYDHNGQRVKKIINGVTTNYTYHGDKIVHLTRGSDSLHIFYDKQGIPTIARLNNADYFYVYDLQGDVIAMVDSAGSIVVEYVYDSWGKLIACSGTQATTLGRLNPFRYRGYVYDEETSLYCVAGRYYNPEWCRFISPDTFEAVTEQELSNRNLYAYCDNNPVQRQDKSGALWGITLGIMAIGGLIGGAVGAAIEAVGQLSSGASLDNMDWKDVGVAFGAGFVAGAVAASPVRKSGQVLWGAIIGGATYVVDSYVNGEDFNPIDFTGNVIGGAASGLIGGEGYNVHQNVSRAIVSTKKTLVREARRANRRYAAKATARALASRSNVVVKPAIISSSRYSVGAISSSYIARFSSNVIRAMLY